ncbi:leucine-rich repeat domain-containing protein [Novipirellula artificiosorum]|uniref:Leucine Rich repeats (2 copies) n=1 Tax=Novipirellula artificiosorum TaxID=2528016 RepID=A0A5C6D5T4_9BACT|nr:leucine-rich repeat domain-containing protein [Novipirellula artificiosorum]TWU32220.1 Leucine Rich repeats (2 copies) [Novipirellula artificiosorum]
MKHHFGDLLDRNADYWTIVPNRDRYAFRIGDVPSNSPEVTIVTIGKGDENWKTVFTLPNLEELTLHEPTREQLHAIGELTSVKRLRITHARPKTIDFLRNMSQVEELVLEYVSGFSDLAPLGDLRRLRALHVENLRRVSSFSGLSGIGSLKYLSICGTLDWKQPIDDFTFFDELQGLEVLSLWQIINKSPYPAMLPAMNLKGLKKLKLHRSYLATNEYALLEVILKGVEGAIWGPYGTRADSELELPDDDVRAQLPREVLEANHPEVRIYYDGKRVIDDPSSLWFEFTGKGAGRAKCSSALAESKCKEFSEQFAEMKQRAETIVTGCG